jgi:hypothetical protein
MKILTWKFALVLGAAVLALPSIGSAACGGTERWFVKVGTDPDAVKVNLGNVLPITVAGLNNLPQLQSTVPHGDNKFRLPEERVVYRVNGRLVLFKDEADGDYHLVITDDSLTYTPGGPSTDGMETGTSFIAEIPNPDCVAGKKGDPSVPSQFAAQLKSARDKFEARFPGGAGTDSELGGIPVILTGIAFYDRPHRQTGRAVNGIELHPLLDIQFDNGSPAPPGTVQPPVGSEITQLLANPGFESGVSAWSGTLEDIGSFGNVPAHQGSNLAWMGGTGSAHTESLYQNVHVPSATPQVALSFWFRIETEETTTTHAYDKFYVQIRDKNGKVLKTLATFSNLDQTSGFVQKTFDVSGYAGQDIQVFFKAVEDEGKISSFWLDDVTLTVQ